MLGYEEALTRRDSLTGDWYDCSAHMVWIGERTRGARRRARRVLPWHRQPDRLQGRAPPPPPTRCWSCANALNPGRVPGRLTLITRMGAEHIERPAPPAAAGGARRGPPRGVGVRPDARQHLHRAERAARPGTSTRSWPRSAASSRPTAPRAPGPAGCTWSSPATTSPSASAAPRTCSTATWGLRYETMCDPRLNGRQSVDLAFRVAELLRGGSAGPAPPISGESDPHVVSPSSRPLELRESDPTRRLPRSADAGNVDQTGQVWVNMTKSVGFRAPARPPTRPRRPRARHEPPIGDSR